MKDVGKRLKGLREGIGLSQAQFAEIIGSTQSSINRYENGQSEIPVALLRRYADFFDVSLDYIYAFSELILHILSFNYTHFLLLEKIIPSISITKS